jgi:hypothetical protein
MCRLAAILCAFPVGTFVACATPVEAAQAAVVCTVNGSLMFTQAPQVVPTSMTVTVSVTGPCTPVLNTASNVTISVTGSLSVSCAGGAGGLSANFFFNTPNPPADAGGASVVIASASVVMAMSNATATGIAALAWSPSTATIPCATQATSVAVTGVFTAVYV